MTDRDPDSDSPRSSGRSCAQGCLIAAGVCTVVIFVLAVVGFLFFVPRPVSELSGSQPGGRITGRIAPPAALTEVREVTLSHATTSAAGMGYSLDAIESVPIAPDGSFAFDAPALEGFYVVSAEGGVWMGDSAKISLIEADGSVATTADVELELERGCVIEVRVTRTTPGASTRGDVRYELDDTDGLLFGALSGSRNGSFGFTAGRIEIGPIPPSSGQVTITMEDGATTTLEVEVESGRIVVGVDL